MSEQPIDTQSLDVPSQPVLSFKEAIGYLSEKFPHCFVAEGEAKPLKIGLFQDLAAALESDDKINKNLLRQVLRKYTLSWRYLYACREGAVRVDLSGNAAGVVDSQQAEHAAQTLAAEKAAYAERRAQAAKEQRKAERKAFFKQKNRDAQIKKRLEAKNDAPKASLESLVALKSKFARK